MKSSVRIALVTAVAVALVPGAAATASPAQGALQVDRPARKVAQAPLVRRVAAASPACADGIIYDDGSPDGTFRLSSGATGSDVDVVMRFQVGEIGKPMDQVCVCWERSAAATDVLNHDLIFYAADGPGGGPGTAISQPIPFQISGIPVGLPTPSTFFDYDVSQDNVVSTTQNVYVGVRWNGGGSGQDGYFLCYDDNGPGNQPMYFANGGQENWADLAPLFPAADPPADPPTALLVRLSPGEIQAATCPTDPCVPDATTLCLNDGRFRVTTDWATVQDTSGQGMAGDLGLTDTGYFWFFNSNNVEMVVKVLNACSFAGRYWVFAGGLTNVEVHMEVCDTDKGILKTYANPLNTPFQPIQDTGAFSTCP